MILIKPKFSEGADAKKLSKRMENQIVRDALGHLGRVFHTDIRPKKFTHRGATEYKYERRSRRYEQRKLRKFGHTRPLELTGETKQMANIVKITNTSKSVKNRYRLRKLNFIPQLREEFQRVSEADKKLLVAEADQFIQSEIDKLPERAN